MYKPFARPFAEGKVSGWYRDPKGGKGTGCNFMGARQVLSLRDAGGGSGFILDNGLSANGIAQYTCACSAPAAPAYTRLMPIARPTRHAGRPGSILRPR